MWENRSGLLVFSSPSCSSCKKTNHSAAQTKESRPTTTSPRVQESRWTDMLSSLELLGVRNKDQDNPGSCSHCWVWWRLGQSEIPHPSRKVRCLRGDEPNRSVVTAGFMAAEVKQKHINPFALHHHQTSQTDLWFDPIWGINHSSTHVSIKLTCWTTRQTSTSPFWMFPYWL